MPVAAARPIWPRRSRRFISKGAERNALGVLQLDKARTLADIQPRRPLALDCEDNRLRVVLILMEGHLDETLSVQKLAATVGVSRRQLERLFTTHLKMAPARAYKLVGDEHAKALLLQSKSPLIEIALEVGFSSASHFASEFKNIVGQAPRQFRQAA